MRPVPCTYIRGGTSRALFFMEKDLPQDKSLWPGLFMKALGVRRTSAGLSAMGMDFPTHKVEMIRPHKKTITWTTGETAATCPLP